MSFNSLYRELVRVGLPRNQYVLYPISGSSRNGCKAFSDGIMEKVGDDLRFRRKPTYAEVVGGGIPEDFVIHDSHWDRRLTLNLITHPIEEERYVACDLRLAGKVIGMCYM